MKKRVVVFSVMALGVVFLATGAFIFVRGQKKTFIMPAVISNVENLSIVSQRLENPEEITRAVVFEFKNDTDNPIVAIGFEWGESGDCKDSEGYSQIGNSDDKLYIALPREVFQIKVHLSDFSSRYPLRISAVVYADGTTTGEAGAANELKERSDEVRDKKTEDHGNERTVSY